MIANTDYLLNQRQYAKDFIHLYYLIHPTILR